MAKLLLLGFLAILVVVCLTHPRIFEKFTDNFVTNNAYSDTDVNVANTSRCASQCVTGGDGRVMDDYGCCQCRATGATFGEDDGYDKRFRICMCLGAGRGDFCFKPVTNLILSQ